MENLYIPRVTQKLFQAASLLDLARATASGQVQTAQVLLESAVMCLAVGYRLYLREIALGRKISAPDRLYSLDDFTEQHLLECPQLAELTQCIWVAELLRAEREALNPPVAAPEVQLIGAEHEAAEPLSLEHASHWLSSFSELVNRQRATQAEY